jgi:hypothetical protein
VQNLTLFGQIAQGVDDETWLKGRKITLQLAFSFEPWANFPNEAKKSDRMHILIGLVAITSP